MSENGREDRLLSLEQFEAALDRFGSRMTHWPEAEQVDARRFLDAHPQASASLLAAERVDEALAALITPDASEAGAPGIIDGQILFGRARMSARDQAPAHVNVRRLAAWGSAVLAASLLIGFVAGASQTTPDEDDGGAYTMLDSDPGNVL